MYASLFCQAVPAKLLWVFSRDVECPVVSDHIVTGPVVTGSFPKNRRWFCVVHEVVENVVYVLVCLWWGWRNLSKQWNWQLCSMICCLCWEINLLLGKVFCASKAGTVEFRYCDFEIRRKARRSMTEKPWPEPWLWTEGNLHNWLMCSVSCRCIPAKLNNADCWFFSILLNYCC